MSSKCQVFFGKFCEYTILDIFFLVFRAHLSITYSSNRVFGEHFSLIKSDETGFETSYYPVDCGCRERFCLPIKYILWRK